MEWGPIPCRQSMWGLRAAHVLQERDSGQGVTAGLELPAELRCVDMQSRRRHAQAAQSKCQSRGFTNPVCC